jgi:hypothetical protein
MTTARRFELFFSDLFDAESIIDSRLQVFCRFVIATLTSANIGGILDSVLDPLNNAYELYFDGLKGKSINKSIKMGSTANLNTLVRNFADAVREKYNLIASKYPKGTPEYVEFFPNGLSAFSKLTRGNILLITNQFYITADKYKSTLGGIPFATKFFDYNTNIIAALEIQTDKKGKVKSINADIITSRAPLELALMAVMFKVGDLYAPNWGKCLSFFDFNLLEANHHKKGTTLKGSLIALEKNNCMDLPLQENNIILLKNPNIIPISFFLSTTKNGNLVGIAIELKPNTEYIATVASFETTSGFYLHVKNNSNYLVNWEVHIKK